jgi:hypothetical protein
MGKRGRLPYDPFVTNSWKEHDMNFLFIALLAFSAAEVRTIRGQILGDALPLGGVLVSDGCCVAQSAADGTYTLPLSQDSGRHIFVTTPRGYWTDRFFVPIETAIQKGRADFALRRMDQPDRFDFAFITDMHLENRRWGIPKFQASLREINGLKPTPAFLWAQGDICLEGVAGKDYLECLQLCRLPRRNGAGNHEMILGNSNPRAEFERLFGPTYYSFDWGPVHCIVLDGNKPIPGEKGWKAVHGAIEGREWTWLQADLAAQPKGKAIIVGVHIPIVSTYPQRRRHSPKDAPYWEMTNHKPLTELFARHQVRLVLQGHMHENERTTVQGVEYAESISLSGSWWKSEHGKERGVDGSPRGYRIISVDGARITHRYRPSCESFVSRQGEFVELPGTIPSQADARFVFNCYDAPNGSSAQARIDQEAWQPMPAYPAVTRDLELTMPHHFMLTTDLTRLPQGPHTIEVRVRWPDRTEVREREVFHTRALR